MRSIDGFHGRRRTFHRRRNYQQVLRRVSRTWPRTKLWANRIPGQRLVVTPLPTGLADVRVRPIVSGYRACSLLHCSLPHVPAAARNLPR